MRNDNVIDTRILERGRKKYKYMKSNEINEELYIYH